MQSYLERIAQKLIKDAGLPNPILEYKFCEQRKWRGDFVWLEPRKVLLEIEGGIWSQGRHTRGKGFTNDCEKLNTASLQGFLVLRVTKYHLISGDALKWLKLALNA